MARGQKNIKPNAERTHEELVEMGAKGGKASVEARRRRKQAREKIRALMDMPVKPSRAQLDTLNGVGYDLEKLGLPSAEMLMLAGYMKKAIDGDMLYAGFLYNYGQVPGMKDVLERERIKAQAEGRAKVDVNLNTAEEAGIMDEITRRLEREGTGNREQGTGETVVGVAEIATTTKTET